MLNEKDVENYWRQELIKLFPGSFITSPYKTDGVLEKENLKVLLEFKYDLDFTNKDSQIICLIQALCYLKRMELKGEKVPHIILIADKNEAFVLHTNDIAKYLSTDLNWSVSPSEAYKHKDFQDLRIKLNNDEKINVFVFNTLTDQKHLESLKDQILNLHSNIVRKIRVTTHNIENVYTYFTSNIAIKWDLTTNELANLFIQLIINPNENYLHPKKKNTLTTKSYGDIKVDTNKFNAFFGRFESENYTNKEKKDLLGSIDRLIEDSSRRKKGEFYTPTIWVNKAHEYIEEAFGENWKEEYVVWDNSCGLGALTKDYKFNELIQTTIEKADIETLSQGNINPNSLKLQLDFLNDEIPESIVKLIENKKVIVLMNPPYKTAGNNKRDSESDEGVAESKTRDAMMKDKWSGYGQLYAQFIYRSLKLKEQYNCEINLAVFAPPLYLSSSSFSKFRDKLFQQVDYHSGFMFRADEFSGTASNWSIVFSIFKHNPKEIEVKKPRTRKKKVDINVI